MILCLWPYHAGAAIAVSLPGGAVGVHGAVRVA